MFLQAAAAATTAPLAEDSEEHLARLAREMELLNADLFGSDEDEDDEVDGLSPAGPIHRNV